MDRTSEAPASSTLVASFATYEEAQEAVDRLADRKFPVEELAIVARDLELVENVTGRRGFAEAGTSGVASGMITGGVVGMLLALLSEPIPSLFTFALQGALVGAVIGLLIGLIAHWAWAGRRDFASVKSLHAGRYELVATPAFAQSAHESLVAAGLVRAGQANFDGRLPEGRS